MEHPRIRVAEAADLIGSPQAPPVLALLCSRRTGEELRRRLCRRQIAWRTLIDEDNDAARLLDRLAGMLEAPAPPRPAAGAAEPTGDAGEALPVDSCACLSPFTLADAAARLLNAIDDRDRSIVLDRLELIEDRAALRLVEHLLEFLPERLSVVLLGDSLPPLGLPRLLVRGRARIYRCETAGEDLKRRGKSPTMG